MWTIVEPQFLRDGSNISIKKCELAIVSLQRQKIEIKEIIHSSQGELKQKEEQSAEYICYWIEAKGNMKHVRETANKMITQNGLVHRTILEVNSKANVKMRRTLYDSKVRGTCKYGMEIWAGTDKKGERIYLDQAENQLLRTFTGSYR